MQIMSKSNLHIKIHVYYTHYTQYTATTIHIGTAKMGGGLLHHMTHPGHLAVSLLLQSRLLFDVQVEVVMLETLDVGHLFVLLHHRLQL